MTTNATLRSKDAKSLTPPRILDVALQLVQEDGIDFSMRDLAARLDVWPMAIYRHFENRDALVEAIVEAVLREALDEDTLARLADEEKSWQLRLTDFALRLYDVLVTYPGISKIITYGVLHTPSGLRLIETVADFLVSIGVREERAAIMFQTAAFFVAEMASLQYAREQGSTDLKGFADRAEAARDEFPKAHNYIQHFVGEDLRERLIKSLQLLFRAVEAEIAGG
ncbi:MAG: helix-turn-helix domain-containing protein [Pseudomonadota bacterium]